MSTTSRLLHTPPIPQGYTHSPGRVQPAVPAGRTPLPTCARGSQPRIVFQEWLTLIGANSTDEVIQPASGWLDAQHSRYTFILTVTQLTANTELILDTAAEPAGPWHEVGAIRTIAPSTIVSVTLSSDSLTETENFERYIRWRVKGGSSPWEICFQIKVFAGNEAAAPDALPRRV